MKIITMTQIVSSFAIEEEVVTLKAVPPVTCVDGTPD